MSNNRVIQHDRDSSSSRREDREKDLQGWSRDTGLAVAHAGGLKLTDAHWEVIDFLRSRYLEKGDAEDAREIADELEDNYSSQGGSRYLRKLFPGGPVTQGSRIAGLPDTAYSVDASFGTSY